jgi:glycosyltransferase involved in cell wall biosynthesis
MNVLFLVPYPTGVAASQRFRFEQYYSVLSDKGIGFTVSPFIDDEVWNVIYLKGNIIIKLKALFIGLFRRLFILFSITKFDYVFIHREALPFGPPILEWLLSVIFKKKIIYDFDDAIWIKNESGYNTSISILNSFSNFFRTCKWSYKNSCGNTYLQQISSQLNVNSIYNPTVVNTDNYHNRNLYPQTTKNSKIVIGWTGSHSTIRYLNDLLPVFKKLEEKYDFELHVIADKKPSFSLKSLVFKPWNKETEVQDLLCFDIGLMPLTDDKWANGKCGFKAIQYMSLDIPALVSPIGVNTKIVDHGINGFLCSTEDEWYHYLSILLSDKELIRRLSLAARPKIIAEYSVLANTETFLGLFS